MDFFELYDARARADEPIELPLRDQRTGEIITMGGKPCIVLVLGANARSIPPDAKAAMLKEEKAEQPIRDRLHAACMRAALAYIAGFKNMARRGEDGEAIPLTLDDAEAFLDLNVASVEHGAWRAPKRNEGETDEEYRQRVDQDRAVWRGASFAQQILDASREESRFLDRPRGN
ncbi:hypothetical protein C4N9_20940 [Pararhodobacter marinus]|uniref:Uncharacterized protein n=1 Tax=Pararhodobacter marinus TaxID=2184063 RepID=A0A2U2C4C1_9RHOB|nr:hypothetical protein [Pararhodobacter marinus]PWE26728.1 hypothetical protein C4N9_20940 [Pararhodobacter marinus]